MKKQKNIEKIYLKINRNKEEKLPEDTYYIVDLIGLDIYTEDGELLGKLDDVFSTGSNDVYVVKDGVGKQILLPAISDVIKKYRFRTIKRL